MAVMVMGKGNGGYIFYSWESETLKQTGNETKFTLVETHWRGHICILSIGLYGPRGLVQFN